MKTETAIDDFVVMMYLLGNDFLPHTPSLLDIYESLEFMIDIYVDLVKNNDFHGFCDVDNIDIDWKAFAMFLEKIAAQEEKLLTERSKKASKIPFTILDDSLEYPTHLITEMSSRLKVVNYDTFRTKWYQRALIPLKS